MEGRRLMQATADKDRSINKYNALMYSLRLGN